MGRQQRRKTKTHNTLCHQTSLRSDLSTTTEWNNFDAMSVRSYDPHATDFYFLACFCLSPEEVISARLDGAVLIRIDTASQTPLWWCPLCRSSTQSAHSSNCSSIMSIHPPGPVLFSSFTGVVKISYDLHTFTLPCWMCGRGRRLCWLRARGCKWQGPGKEGMKWKHSWLWFWK